MTYATEQATVGREPIVVLELDMDFCAYEYGNSYTNLLTYSEQFDHADWTKSTGLVNTANAITAPDGTLTADLLEDDDAAATEFAYQDVTVADDTVSRTFSCYLKEGTAAVTKFVIQYRSVATFTRGLLLTWATRTVAASNSPVDFGIEEIVNGWVRVWVTVANSGTGNTSARCLIWTANDDDVADVGTVYAWGAQLVANAARGHYVKTEAASAIGVCRAGVSFAEYKDWAVDADDSAAVNANLTHSTLTKSLTLTPTAGDPNFHASGNAAGSFDFDGATFDKVRLKVRKIDDTGSPTWEGECWGRSASHGYTGGESVTLSDPSLVVGVWQVIEWDMSGSTWWPTEANITNVRIDITSSNAGAWEIEWFDIVSASPAAGSECYNTQATCQDLDNYTKHLKTYRCCEKIQALPAGINMIPAITGISNAPTRIVNDFGLGHRASVTVSFDDHPHHDRGIDPYASTRTYTAETQGTFWGKFRARNLYYAGRAMRLRVGYMGTSWDWANFENREYIIETIVGPDSRGGMKLTGKDILKLADDKRAVCPAVSEGELTAGVGVADTTLTVAAGTYNDPAVTLANEWIVVNGEIIKYTALTGTGTTGDPWTFTGLVRTDVTWGSTNSAHSTDDAVQQCKAWESVNVRDIIDELLVTYASLPSSYIIAADWDSEEGSWLTGYNLTTILHEPVGVSELIAELQEQCQLRIWWDEVAQQVKLKALTPPLGNIPTVLNDTSNVLADSLKVKDDTKDRISQVWVHYDPKDYTEDETKNYQKVYIATDSTAETAVQYGDSRIHKIYSRWFNENHASISAQTASRLLANRRDAPRTIRFSMDAKDAAGTITGDVRDLELDDIQGADGALDTTRVLITQVKESKYGHRFDYTGLTGIGDSRFGFIGPNSLNDYTAESAANQLSYCFVCDSSTLKMSNGDDSYKII